MLTNGSWPRSRTGGLACTDSAGSLNPAATAFSSM